jgi:hypothetical protein
MRYTCLVSRLLIAGVAAGVAASPLHRAVLSDVVVALAVAATFAWSAWVRHDLHSCALPGARRNWRVRHAPMTSRTVPVPPTGRVTSTRPTIKERIPHDR